MYKHFNMGILALIIASAMVSCKPKPTEEPDAPGTHRYTESTEEFCNPERGFFIQQYFTTKDLTEELTVDRVKAARANQEWHYTLYLTSYYMTAYMDGDIAQAALDRLEHNMLALREGGAKCVLRFAYKDNFAPSSAPFDPTPAVVSRHIEQIKPYLQKYADVILCMQAGFIGSWGEWYYTTNFIYQPTKDEDFEPRWKVAEQLFQALPESRQICFRYPALKRRYMRMHSLNENPLDSASAHKGDIRSRWAAHNDAFVSSENDLGTYTAADDRTWHSADTKYVVNGGESCGMYYSALAERAIKQLEDYHITYLNSGYLQAIIEQWKQSGMMPEFRRRMGYRLVLDKAVITPEPKAGQELTVDLSLRNVGFAAPVNPRGVELVLVSAANPADKKVYKQKADPRFWLGGEARNVQLSAMLDAQMQGDYNLYLNLPDTCATLYNRPEFSIRLANENMWEAKTGFNKLATITVK
ncbi:MAG: DUF4832 domain-containing protein [Paludibacteraceae bacterium]|nr:DUF4832 domain-containing protein [Paludibacteraceae bacterium]